MARNVWRRQITFALLPGLLALMTGLTASADTGKKSATSATAEQETERIVQQLVQAHLPELSQVLNQLRAVQPQEYERAIKDLAKSARKLELAQNRDQRLFEIEVELLQAEHHASLLMAKLKVRDSQSDRDRLRDAAKRLQQAQIARAEYDVETLRQRLARSQQLFDAAVARLETHTSKAEDQLEKSFLSMLRKAGRDAKQSDPAPKTSSKRRAEPTNSTKSSTDTPPRQ